MVNNQGRTHGRDENHVQDLELRRVQKEDEGAVQNARGDWLLDIRAVLFHDRHLRRSTAYQSTCVVCAKGLEGAMAPPTDVARQREVAAGDGGDPEGDTASSRGDGPDREPDKMLERSDDW